MATDGETRKTQSRTPTKRKNARPLQIARWQVHVATTTLGGKVGPSAMAVAVFSPDGKRQATRSWYLGCMSNEEAERTALVVGQALAVSWQLPGPVFLSSCRAVAPRRTGDVR